MVRGQDAGDGKCVWWGHIPIPRRRPSKPWGCRSRRCRRRTWRSCDACEAFEPEATWTPFSRRSIPRSSGTHDRRGMRGRRLPPARGRTPLLREVPRELGRLCGRGKTTTSTRRRVLCSAGSGPPSGQRRPRPDGFGPTSARSATALVPHCDLLRQARPSKPWGCRE